MQVARQCRCCRTRPAVGRQTGALAGGDILAPPHSPCILVQGSGVSLPVLLREHTHCTKRRSRRGRLCSA